MSTSPTTPADPAGNDAIRLAVESTGIRTERLGALRFGLRLAERISPALAARLAGRLFRAAPRHPMPARERAWCEGAERLRIPYSAPAGADADSPRALSALSFGHGPTVLLVHGWSGRGSQMAAFAAPLAAAGFRAVALDTPAHGESGGKRSSLPEFTSAIQAAAIACGPLFAVVGHSFGTAATAVALRQGLALERLVFLAPPFDLDVYFALFLRLLGLGEETHARLVKAYERRFGLVWEELQRVTHEGTHPQPLLVVHDEDDQETPFEGGRAVAAAWPNGAFFATKGLGHRRLLRSEAVVARVVAFLLEREPFPPHGANRPVSAGV